MKHFDLPPPETGDVRIASLERQLAREKAARKEAEQIAEKGLRELYQSQRRLALLQRITEGSNSAEDSRDILHLALNEICAEMEWDFGNAYRVERGTGTAFACDCWHAANPDGMLEFVEASRRIRLTGGSGLPGRVLRDRRAHWIDDVRTDPHFLRGPAARNCGVVTGCCVPIFIGDEIVALIEFFSRRLMLDTPGLVGAMAQIANQIGRVFERERTREALLHDALHDALTGLPNRVLLSERAAGAFVRLPPSREGIALLVVDLNGFKAVNDRHGHHAGDCVLVTVARRLEIALVQASQNARQAWRATLARIGGDEFVVLIDDAQPGRTAAMVASALHGALAQPIELAGDELTIGASIGVAESSARYAGVEQMLRDADLAMYEAKALGRSATVVFTPDLGHQVRSRMALETEIRDAIRDQQFVLHYQPIFSLDGDPRLHGFEALVRWNHPVRGLIQPSEFIPAAEETGLIVFLGDWILREACTAMARLHRSMTRDGATPALPFISINIAPQQFLQPNFARQVRRVLMETGVPPACVKLEVTEGVAIIDPERTRAVLEQFRSWGVRTGLDDFGTGYSSLSYLHTMPFDTLKIDRSFIAALDQPKSRKIVRTILDLADNLELSVVAEGIETAEQGEILGNMGCRMGQGYLLGYPLNEQAAFALVGQPLPEGLMRRA